MTRNLTVAPSALHTLAADYRGHSTGLAAHAADLAAIGGQVDVFGPVGAAFAAALTEATRHQAQLAHHLSARLDAGATTAVATANTFIVTDHNAGGRIGTWW
ncbi:type VII secretion target [Mycobacterium sp. SMC-16]|uniref:type VII secretion target n=1 Tax=Mycobacteriaceae TaxID=1762 RepID=UPI00226AE62F|nr:type VII secretion target [Mycolicibacterium mucogenicum]MCX8554245.1 type VII secretion target [Mycolicibacterium mucogenicum]